MILSTTEQESSSNGGHRLKAEPFASLSWVQSQNKATQPQG